MKFLTRKIFILFLFNDAVLHYRQRERSLPHITCTSSATQCKPQKRTSPFYADFLSPYNTPADDQAHTQTRVFLICRAGRGDASCSTRNRIHVPDMGVLFPSPTKTRNALKPPGTGSSRGPRPRGLGAQMFNSDRCVRVEHFFGVPAESIFGGVKVRPRLFRSFTRAHATLARRLRRAQT